MIQTLFGTWKRRGFTLAAVLVSFSVGLIVALGVAVGRAPQTAEAVRKIPVAGPAAVSLAEWRYGPLTAPPAATPDVETVRQMRPISTEEITQLVQNLKEQRQSYIEKQEALSREEKRIEYARQELDQEREQITALRDKVVEQWEEIKKARAGLDQHVTELQEVEAKNLKQLASNYEAMRPELAAPILKKLDEATAAKTLFLMKERSAAKIMEKLDQDTAAKLMERMALLKTTN